MKRKIAAVAAVLLALCWVLGGCGKSNPDINYNDVDRYMFETDAAFQAVLEENGLTYQSANNTVEQYASIKQHLREEDVYVYCHVLGTVEADKICVVFGYADLDDYLTQHGYVDGDGNPSWEAWREAAYIWMTQEMAQRNAEP